MVELVDTRDLKSLGFTAVRVQVPLCAPLILNLYNKLQTVMNDIGNAQIIWDYMRFNQLPKKADIIIGLGSTDLRTAEHCASLYHQGYAPLILFTGARGRITREAFSENEAEIFARRAAELGVPKEAILKEATATNTAENIISAYKLLEEKGIPVGSVLVVAKPYTLRRVYATFLKQWPGLVKPTIRCSTIDQTLLEYCQDTLYPLDFVTSAMVGDLQRLWEYGRLGHLVEQEIPKGVLDAYTELVKRGYTRYLLQ